MTDLAGSRLTAERRARVEQLVMHWRTSLPLDPERSYREVMPGEESWYVTVREEAEVVGHVSVHRVPLGTLRDVGWECETGDAVPGWPVVCTTEFDQPSPGVVKRLRAAGSLVEMEATEGDSLLVLDDVVIGEQWAGFGLESLLAGTAMQHLRGRDVPSAHKTSCSLYRSPRRQR